MKTILLVGVALVVLIPAQAQILRPAAAKGALIGGLAGAVIGNNSGSLHHNAWRGAAIGATAGLLIGSAVDDARYSRGGNRSYVSVSTPGFYVYRHAPLIYRGHGHYPHRHIGYVHHHYGYPGYRVGYRVYNAWPSYRASGVFFGGLSGAIIGNNSRRLHHDAWRGAAWGAGIGYVFGSIAEQNARARAVIEQSPAVAIPSSPAPVVQPRQVTIINNYYNAPATPMSSANGLFGRN
jgi:hypothetical protein